MAHLSDLLPTATIDTMFRSALTALPMDPAASPADAAQVRHSAMIALASFHVRDPIEAMLATRIVTAHYAAMECFRRAALPENSNQEMLRLHAKAVSLANLSDRTVRELTRLQAEAPAHPVPEEMLDEADTREQPARTPAAPPPATAASQQPEPPHQHPAGDTLARQHPPTAEPMALAA